MAIIDKNVSMPRSIFEAKNLISNPHILAIFITGDIDYFKRIKQPELLWQIRQALRPGVTYIAISEPPRRGGPGNRGVRTSWAPAGL